MEVSDGLLTGKRLKNLTSCALAFKLFSVRTAGNALCLRMRKYYIREQISVKIGLRNLSQVIFLVLAVFSTSMMTDFSLSRLLMWTRSMSTAKYIRVNINGKPPVTPVLHNKSEAYIISARFQVQQVFG